MTYAYLFEKGIIVPPRVTKEKDSAFEGAYVKIPQVGLHHYVASFDLNSLYPHLMMQYSISPENLVERSYIEDRKQKLIQELKIRNL
jgi:DNA polymerase elongation subunit (family B)